MCNGGEVSELKLIAQIIFLLFIQISLQAAPSEVSLFERCYSQLTGAQAAVTHPLYLQVKSGQMSALSACLWVLDRAEIIGTGANAGLTRGQLEPVYAQTDTQDALKVLRVFFDFHATWFMHPSIKQALLENDFTANDELVDSKEGAAHLSYFLHQPSLTYSDLLRGNRSVRVRRDTQPGNTRFGHLYGSGDTRFFDLSYLRHNFLKPYSAENKALVQPFPSPVGFLELGEIRGFRALNSTELDQTLVMGFQSNAPNNVNDPLRVNYTDIGDGSAYSNNVEVKFRRPYGGGLLGTQSYLIENLGAHGQGFYYPRSDGGVRTWRRAAKAIYSDFLCRDIPVISGSDAAQFMAVNPPHPFQKSASCMACHATTDGLAGTLRNFSFVTPTNFGSPATALMYEPFTRFVSVIEHPTALIASGGTLRKLKRDHPQSSQINYATQTSNFYGINSDNTFARQSPEGRVLIRDMNGNLINEAVTGVEQLGTTLSNIDDYYMCAASRYFNFLTGFKASTLEVPNASPEEIQARLYVVQLGNSLKIHQSLRTMVSEILGSSYWREGIE